MMVNIANPIYDSVFKYLMEDERIAKTLISALLKKDFDQSLKEKGNHQVLSVDEDKFNGDLRKRIRDASVYGQKKYRPSFYS